MAVAYLGTVLYRSMSTIPLSSSSVKNKIDKSIKFNKPSAIIPASDKHTASLIFLHGVGDIGQSWMEVFHMYHIAKIAPYIKYIFPTAPKRRITLNNGLFMNAWFDIYELHRNAKEDQKGIIEASNYVHELIEDEINNGIPSERVIIGGFSQGGATVLHAALTTHHSLAGVLALSTWLPLSATFPKGLIAGEKKTNLSILQCHGNADTIVDIEWGRLSKELFKLMNFEKYQFKEYDQMAHSSNMEEIKDVIGFIKENLPKNYQNTEMSKGHSVIPAVAKHTASLIFLHGLGDVGASWMDAFDHYRISKAAPHVKFIFPNAPVQRVTLNMGMPMPTWFDIHGLDQNAKEDQEGIEKASKLLNDIVEEEIKHGIAPERVIVGGFSMGGAVALHAALTSPHKLGGVLALSTWLPLSTTFPKALVSGEKKINLPILQCHGDQDPMVQPRWAHLTEQGMKAMGFKHYTFKQYKNMGHSSCDEEMNDVSAFVVQNLPKID